MLRRANRLFAPPTDIIELEDKLLIMVEIAGMRATDFDIVLHNRTLTIVGMRERLPLENPAYHQVEINFGEFRIDLTLPWPVQRDGVSASYQHGFLYIELPRRPVEQVNIMDLSAEERDEQ
jgi:HSP20 family protein